MTVTSPRTTEPRTLKRKKQILIKSAAAAAALMAIWAAAGLFLYVAPEVDSRAHADVLFVLGPPDQRMDYAEKLMQQGYAPTLAVSVPLGKTCKYNAPICNVHRPYRVICFHREPFTTQGEAQALRDMSDKYGWKSADVLTAPFHVTRARVIVDRCYKGPANHLPDRLHRLLGVPVRVSDSGIRQGRPNPGLLTLE